MKKPSFTGASSVGGICRQLGHPLSSLPVRTMTTAVQIPLLESSDTLRALLDGIHTNIFIADAGLHLLYHNR